MLYILNNSQNSLISFHSTKNCLDAASLLGRPDRLIVLFVSRQENHIQSLWAIMKRLQAGEILLIFFISYFVVEAQSCTLSKSRQTASLTLKVQTSAFQRLLKKLICELSKGKKKKAFGTR